MVLLARLEEFIASTGAPALLEPGELPLPLEAGSYQLSARPSFVLIEAWTQQRNLARRVVALGAASGHKLELVIERFGGKAGKAALIDLSHAGTTASLRQAGRDVLRERLRTMAARQFPGWHLSQVTAGADLEHSLSPSFPRALLTKGDARLALLAAPAPVSAASPALTYGLIWHDYLCRRAPRSTPRGLVLFVPQDAVNTFRLRLRAIHPSLHVRLFAYDAYGGEGEVDPGDTGNLDTSVSPANHQRLEESALPAWIRRLAELPDVEASGLTPGVWSLRIRGLEFARVQHGEVWCGLDKQERVRSPGPVEQLALALGRVRSPVSADPRHSWNTRAPEAWLESVVRTHLETIDSSLAPGMVYSQAPALAGLDRGLIDLLAIDRSGQLVVLELKAAEDANLPVQALDYWVRVAGHARRGDFHAHGYFPGYAIRPEPPRLLLVAPALQFHPTTETVLSYFAPSIAVERIGLGVEWQSSPRIMLRIKGARRPEWDSLS